MAYSKLNSSMHTLFLRLLPPSLIFSMLVACASPGKIEVVPAKADTQDKQAETALPRVELNSELLYELLVGEIAGQRGQIGIAASTLGNVAKKTRDPRVAERATLSSLYAKRYEEALSSARLWVELRPRDTEANEALITALLELDKGEEAKSLYEKLFSSEDTRQNLNQSYLRAAAVLGRASNRDAAIVVMRSLVALNPQEASAYYSLSHLMVRGGDLDGALDSANETLKRRSNWEEAALLKVRILLSLKEVQKARAFYESFLSNNRGATTFRLNYARFLIDQKEWEKAYSEFKQVAADAPNDADTIYAVGLLALQNNHLDEAKIYLIQALKLRPENDQARLYLGQVADQANRYEEAIAWYREIEDGEYFFEAQTRLGVAMAKMGDLDGARRQLDNIDPQNDPQRVQVALAFEQILREAKQYREALEKMNVAIKLVPGDKDLLYARALIAEKLDMFDLTERDLREILKSDPKNANALNALGYTLTDRTTRFQEALELLQQAIALKPDDAFILDSMGWLQYRLGNNVEAVKYLKRALEIRNDAEIAAHLGEVLWVMGNRQEAENIWNRALSETPDSEALNDVIKKFKP